MVLSWIRIEEISVSLLIRLFQDETPTEQIRRANYFRGGIHLVNAAG